MRIQNASEVEILDTGCRVMTALINSALRLRGKSNRWLCVSFKKLSMIDHEIVK
jgi:hypothetical protein